MTKTREEMIDEIRAACIKANPEIVELNLGCRIRNANGVLGTLVYVYGRQTNMLHVLIDGDWHTQGEWTEQQGIEVIGRPIRLADVLLAMQEAPKTTKIVIDDYGVFWDFNTLRNSTVQERPFSWNLRTDDLTAQSDETITFIHSLLTV